MRRLVAQLVLGVEEQGAELLVVLAVAVLLAGRLGCVERARCGTGGVDGREALLDVLVVHLEDGGGPSGGARVGRRDLDDGQGRVRRTAATLVRC